MKMWNWYVARSNELMLDIDNPRSLVLTKKRLRGAIESGVLEISTAYLFTSSQGNHFHAVIILSHYMPAIERFVWEMILRSDVYRGCNNIMRELNWISSPGLLIAKKPLRFREPDIVCFCEKKHSREIMQSCPAAKRLRGENRDKTFFGKITDDTFENFIEP